MGFSKYTSAMAKVDFSQPTEALLNSSLGHATDAASGTFSYLRPYLKDLIMAIPRLFAHLGSFAFIALPERIDHLFRLPNGGSIIAEATGNRTRAMASAAISSAKPVATMAPAGGAAASESAKAGLFSHATFRQIRSFGGIFPYMTSKWALACFALVRAR